MSNVISFQQAAENRKRFTESAQETKESFYAMSRSLIRNYRDMGMALQGGSFNPTLVQFHFWVANAMEVPGKENLQEEMLRFGGCINNLGDFLDAKNGVVNCCFRLSNSRSYKDIDDHTLTAIAMGTKEGILSTFGYDVDSLIFSQREVLEPNAAEVKGVVYDYIYSHPAVDTDKCIGVLGALVYEVVTSFCNAGYALSDWQYNKEFNKEANCNIPTPLVMKFIQQGESDLEKEIYLYFDHDALIKSKEIMFQSVFGDDDTLSQGEES